MTAATLKRLRIDPDRETKRIATALRDHLGSVLGRRGLVVAMSGGSPVPVDSLCQAVRFGAAASLDKPLKREGLLATVNRVLQS